MSLHFVLFNKIHTTINYNIYPQMYSYQFVIKISDYKDEKKEFLIIKSKCIYLNIIKTNIITRSNQFYRLWQSMLLFLL